MSISIHPLQKSGRAGLSHQGLRWVKIAKKKMSLRARARRHWCGNDISSIWVLCLFETVPFLLTFSVFFCIIDRLIYIRGKHYGNGFHYSIRNRLAQALRGSQPRRGTAVSLYLLRQRPGPGRGGSEPGGLPAQLRRGFPAAAGPVAGGADSAHCPRRTAGLHGAGCAHHHGLRCLLPGALRRDPAAAGPEPEHRGTEDPAGLCPVSQYAGGGHPDAGVLLQGPVPPPGKQPEPQSSGH